MVDNKPSMAAMNPTVKERMTATTAEITARRRVTNDAKKPIVELKKVPIAVASHGIPRRKNAIS
jgi:hypothetical protein